MSITLVTVRYETDALELVCKYYIHTTPGFTLGLPENCYPDESEIGEPEYYLDGVFISSIPAELVGIADAMYESEEDERFTYTYKEDYDDGPDPEYD